jgi:tRNA(Ile)-lysidine synthase
VKGTAVETAVRRALREAALGAPGHTVLAALSGGPDSVALLDALATLSAREGFAVQAAHLDHGLREGSAADAVFCARLCQRLGVPLHSGTADVTARARREGGGIEQASRRERYGFLRAVAARIGADTIAVAHNRDDQAETVLMRLLRGSGRTGLSAMKPRSRDLLRPLLGVSRQQVMAHLRLRRLPWREDPTNADTRLLRNRVRHELMPYLESRFNTSVRATLARTASVVTSEAALLDRQAARLAARVARRQEGRVVLQRAGLAAAPEALARLVLRKAIGRGARRVHVERLLGLVRSRTASGRRLPLPGGREALVRFGEMWIGPADRPWGDFEAPLSVPGQVDLPDGSRLTARESGRGLSGAGVVVPLPDEPMVVRTRRPGDRVLTARGERSLKRLLLERRMPADARERLPLVAAGPHVIWFPGLAPAEEAAADGRYMTLSLLQAEEPR